MEIIPSTLFTAPAHWHWLVVFYFFFGGLAGGSFFLAAMVDLFGADIDRPLARLGYYVSFLTLLPAGPLLILDLNRPERFWHMLIQSNNPPWPMIKVWSPISVGSWALLFFGAFSLLMVLGSLAETGRFWRPFHIVRHGFLKSIIAVLGGLTAFFLASYTGVLLAVTNRPIWSDTSLLGLLFLLSAGSTAAALLLLIAYARRRIAPESVLWLKRMDIWALALELLVLLLLVVSLGALLEIWMSIWGVLLGVGVVLLGIIIPLLLYWRSTLLGRWSGVTASILVLVGGFIMRTVIILSSEEVGEVTTWLLR